MGLEYKMYKCTTCGGERRGPRIIRLTPDDLIVYELIERNTRWTPIIVVVVMSVVAMLSIVAVLTTSPLFTIFIALALVTGIVGNVAIKNHVAREEETLVSAYGVKKNEWYMIAK